MGDGSLGALGALGSHVDESRNPIGHLDPVTPYHPVLPQFLHNNFPITKLTVTCETPGHLFVSNHTCADPLAESHICGHERI